MTECKAVFKETPQGIDVRIGWNETPDATKEEKALAQLLAPIINDWVIKLGRRNK